MREVWDLDITIDVQPVVLGGQNDGAVLHQGHVEALGMLYLEKIRPVRTKKMSGVKVSTLLSRAPSNWPAWLKTVRLKLLWLSAMQISPEAVSPTPIGKLLTVKKRRN